MARNKKPNLLMKTFKLSPQCVNAIERLAEKYSNETKISISMAKIIELGVFTIEKKTLKEVLAMNK